MSKNRKNAVEGSFKVKLIPISTPEEAQEALEAAISIIIGSASGSSTLCSRENEGDVENKLFLCRQDVRGETKAQ